jgi:uncharacterized protein (TIGR00288 family)
MNPTETRSTRIAVFIDFDNVEIGVKSTIGGQFDIGLVLEAIKERGEIVTKIAYSDWKRAGDYSRILTQHAIRMVQRNLTPGGDKNGADITMALDALEMAFTHDHINAFVIVGGDSDFISLVEKLKQYGRKVIVVGGRQFTSTTMQKNCHEFIAYENLIGSRGGRSADRGGRPVANASIAQALPLVKRALKVLSEREVTPQLGLLKSTLLQLDSTFSERDYGASSFRDFMEKVAQTGAVTLKHAGRSMLVESREDGAPMEVVSASGEAAVLESPQPVNEQVPDGAAGGDDEEEEALPASPMSMQDGIRAIQAAFTRPGAPPRWPMYVRQAKQFLRNAIENFDERRYGFASVVDLLRAAAKEGVLRIERDRQGAVRVFPGNNLESRTTGPSYQPIVDGDEAVEEAMSVEAVEVDSTSSDGVPSEIVDAPAESVSEADVLDAESAPPAVVESPIAHLLAFEPDVEEPTEGDVDGNRIMPDPPRGSRNKSQRRAPSRAAKTTRAPRPAAAKSARAPRSRKSTRG